MPMSSKSKDFPDSYEIKVEGKVVDSRSTTCVCTVLLSIFLF